MRQILLFFFLLVSIVALKPHVSFAADPTPSFCGSHADGSYAIDTKTNNCTIVDTSVGPVNVTGTNFIESMFGVLLSVSGGIAVLLIIISGYQIMLSQGNPEHVKGAKERLTAAIVGILFMIFSVIILEIIGVNILHLPGFSQ